jgi:hypothetical protein
MAVAQDDASGGMPDAAAPQDGEMMDEEISGADMSGNEGKVAMRR